MMMLPRLIRRVLLSKMDKHTIAAYFQGLQDRICAGISATDGGATFKEDQWQRPEGGGGRSRVLAKGAISVSYTHLTLPTKRIV